MSSNSPLTSPRLKSAVVWVSEQIVSSPQKSRRSLCQEAQLRFDLTPAECAFLEEKFGQDEQPSESPQ